MTLAGKSLKWWQMKKLKLSIWKVNGRRYLIAADKKTRAYFVEEYGEKFGYSIPDRSEPGALRGWGMTDLDWLLDEFGKVELVNAFTN